jgi:hypothetical protein
VSNDCETEILGSDSHAPTTISCKQLLSCPLVYTSESETSIEKEESSELHSTDDKTSDMWCNADKKPRKNFALESQV